jgi:predicted membrane-bound spermidine synthase
MFGLGIGSLLGGILCGRYPGRLRELFVISEAVIGVFGLASIFIIRRASDVVIHGDIYSIGLTVFVILCLPTMMMGATLPILVTHINQHRQNLGNSVGWLYFFNTIGSALAALLTVTVLFPAVGLQYTVWIAAALNFVVAGLVFASTRSSVPAAIETRVKA